MASLAFQRRINGRSTYAKVISKLSHSRSVCSSRSNLKDHCIGKLPLGSYTSTFLKHIPSVIRICPEPQVSRIYAQRVVPTGAIMEYAHPRWNRSVMQLPRKSVGAYIFSKSFFTETSGQNSVTIISSSGPQPAPIGFGDVSPKTIHKRHSSTTASGTVLLCPAVLRRPSGKQCAASSAWESMRRNVTQISASNQATELRGIQQEGPVGDPLFAPSR